MKSALWTPEAYCSVGASRKLTRAFDPLVGATVASGLWSKFNRCRWSIFGRRQHHARRKFVEVWETSKSPAAQTAITHIASLYAIESEVKDLTVEERQRQRQARAGPILDAFRLWLEATHAKTGQKSALGKAIQYSLNRWKALLRYVEDGRINIDNNPVENAIRGIALGRKNYLFCGSEGGGHRAALMYSLIESAKMKGINPGAYLLDVLTKLPTAKHDDLDALMPWNFGK